ncbi:hypothetical protein ACET3Z_024998 [Daucus carota]
MQVLLVTRWLQIRKSLLLAFQADDLRGDHFRGSKWLVLRYGIYNLEVIHAAVRIAKQEQAPAYQMILDDKQLEGSWFLPRKGHPVIKFFEINYFEKSSIDKGALSPLEIESLYWNANVDEPFEVEYGNDVHISAFVELEKRRGGDGFTDDFNVGDTDRNLRGTARAEGCPPRFIEDDIPGVTSPMVYMDIMLHCLILCLS